MKRAARTGPAPARWGQARIEVDALRPEIVARLATGTPIKRVYDDLHEAGRITISAKVFYRWVGRLRADAAPPKRNPVSPPPTPTAFPHPPAPSGRRAAVPPSCPERPRGEPVFSSSTVISADLPQLREAPSASLDDLWAGDDTPELEKDQ